jgi:hypothetical protein
VLRFRVPGAVTSFSSPLSRFAFFPFFALFAFGPRQFTAGRDERVFRRAFVLAARGNHRF